MAHQPNLDAPIFKLHRDILWEIFSIIVNPSPYPTPNHGAHRFPLTNARSCSQVCSFWRKIIIESPSIWGNCLDLDLLDQDDDNWRHEVLRRTGNALLALRDRPSIMHYPPIGLQKFTIDVISDHWERIKILDFHITDEIVGDKRVQTAFCRPAPRLRVFALHDENIWNGRGFSMPLNSQLFANNAPLLARFHVGDHIVSDASLFPFPSFLISGRLRHLTLAQSLVIPAVDLLAACAQMPLLEELSMVIANLTLETPKDRRGLTSSLQSVSLPRLKSLWINSLCLDIYPGFLGRLIGCPYKMDIYTMLDSIPEYSTETLQVYADEIQDVLLRDMSSFIQSSHITRSSGIKYLIITLSSQHISLVTRQELNLVDAYASTVFETNTLPLAIRESFTNTLLSLNFPATLVRFQFVFPGHEDQWSIPSLSPLFIAVGSITELCTSLEGLAYINEQSVSGGVTFFPALEVLFLLDTIGTRNTTDHLKTFFYTRQHNASVQVLNLTESRQPFGDLRFLDEMDGLEVVWRHMDPRTYNTVITEYVCGSGDPEQLLHT